MKEKFTISEMDEGMGENGFPRDLSDSDATCPNCNSDWSGHRGNACFNVRPLTFWPLESILEELKRQKVAAIPVDKIFNLIFDRKS